jgi:hypothetical protein
MEPIAWMISQQLTNSNTSAVPDFTATSTGEIVFGAKMLKLAVAFDSFKMKGLSDEAAMTVLRARRPPFDGELMSALAGFKPDNAKAELRKVPVAKLITGMILQQEIKTKGGMLVVANGQEVTHALLIRLDNFARAGTIEKEIMALVPV